MPQRRRDNAAMTKTDAPRPRADGVRLDKWLWVARLFKTRALAAEAIERGRLQVNRLIAKASREVHVGDVVELHQPPFRRVLEVRGLGEKRGPAKVAQTMYAETPDSIAERERIAAEMRTEPALAREAGRPTKRDRRELAEWQRWSAKLPD
jgi:ribosome-associated heat shock protein Hsp15